MEKRYEKIDNIYICEICGFEYWVVTDTFFAAPEYCTECSGKMIPKIIDTAIKKKNEIDQLPWVKRSINKKTEEFEAMQKIYKEK